MLSSALVLSTIINNYCCIVSKKLSFLKFANKFLVVKSILMVINFLLYGSVKLTLIICYHAARYNSKVPTHNPPRS